MLAKLRLICSPKTYDFASKFRLLGLKYSCTNYVFSLLLIVLLSSNFVLLGLNRLSVHTDPAAYDTTAYLGEANLIKQNGGITNFFNLCITGKYKQANQHPLYILVLTPFASTDISFFIYAKIASLVIGFVLLICLFIMGRKMYGDLCASIAVSGLLLNSVFLEWTTLVGCESLEMLFSLLTMYFVLRGFENNRCWLYAGIFAGFTYLTKGTALFLIPGFVFSSLIVYRLKIFKNKYFWSFFILFIVVASPLIIRNVRVYKNPFFNVNIYIATLGGSELNSSRYQTFDLEEGAGLWKFDKSESENPQLKPSPHNSFKLFDLSKKIMNGIVKEGKVFLRDIVPIQNALPNLLVKIYALLLFSFFIVGIVREKNFGGKVYIITTLLTFLVLLSLFRPIDRYFLPIIPLVWIYIALGILTVLDLANKTFFSKSIKSHIISYVPHFLIVVLLTIMGYVFSTKAIANPAKSVQYSDSRLELLSWLRVNLDEGEKYTLGPNFNWQLKKGTWILPPKNARVDFSKFSSFVGKHGVSYVIMEREDLNKDVSLEYGVVPKRKLIEGYFELDPVGGIVEKKRVGGWVLVFKDKKKPVGFLVYKLVGKAS